MGGITPPIALLDGPWWPYLALLLFAVLPTEIWRWLAVIFAQKLDEHSPALELVRLVATALLAGVVAKLVITPSGALATLPLLLRLGALAAGLGVMALNRRRILTAVVIGEGVLIGGGLWLG
jgi:Branched-chain amino acid transport protein (AzlD)